MENKPVRLEVGMALYWKPPFSNGNLCRAEIVRTTEKRAMMKSGSVELVFDRDQVRGDFIEARGSNSRDRWNTSRYEIETPALLQKWARQQAIAKIMRVKWENISDDTISLILELLPEKEAQNAKL